MQYRLWIETKRGTKGYVCERSGDRPAYAAFTVVSADNCTVAPTLAFAKGLKNRFIQYCEKYGEHCGLGYDIRKLIFKKVIY